jgi:glyoxylase-like metal-dependent hydrolase (beta-lactamase superfamily II)
MQKLADGIYFENSFPGVTLGAVIQENSVIMIDAPLRSEDSRSWRTMLFDQSGWSNRMLVFMDAHPDRTLGAKAMESTIVSNRLTSEKFHNRTTIFKGQGLESGCEWELYNETVGMRWAAPDILFSERMSIEWGEPEVVMEHHPGPTPEESWLIVPDRKVIFVGDTVVLNQPPFLADANLNEWMDSLTTLLRTYKDYKMISSRGGLFDGSAIKELRKFLKGVAGRMERLSAKNAEPEATGNMVSSLLGKFDYPASKKNMYTDRLRHGCYHCYLKNYTSLDYTEEEILKIPDPEN